MDITPPFGYQKIVPLQRDARVRPSQNRLPDFVLNTNCMPLLAGEAAIAGHEFPLLFVKNNEREYTLLAILGLSDGENLIASAEGWAPFTYVPLHVRRHPFCMTRVMVNGVAQSQVIVCVEEQALTSDEGGIAHFDASDQPTPEWTQFHQFLQQFETEAQRTRELFTLFADFKLFEDTVARVQTTVGEFQLGGLARIDEKRLENLTSAQLKVLIKKGGMAVIYQHLASLVRFDRLSYLKAERVQKAGGAPVAPPDGANAAPVAGAELA